MIIHNVDELLALFDRFAEDKAREFRTAVLLDDALDDNRGDVIDAAEARQAAAMERWRTEMRERLATMPIRFPLTLRWTHHEKDV